MKRPKIEFLTVIIILLLTLCQGQEPEDRLELEYRRLYALTDDKTGLESIRVLHKQLDDDNDGTIEPAETCDFIRADLQKDTDQQQLRQKRFHVKDAEITVKDLWNTWWKGEVHNWTVDQTVLWLIHNVELPQYELDFRRHAVDGAKLPQVAIGSSYLSKVVGVTNPIHRSKITLKAMDVVLFGPPKELISTWKDAVLTALLFVAISSIFMAFRQNKRSQDHLRRMASDMEGLSKAEEELLYLQAKLHQSHSKLELMELNKQQQQDQHQTDSCGDIMEVSRLKEQIEVLRNELQRAEIELEDRCWIAPPVLQQWLQITYELESQVYNAKKKAAENQLETAKDLCEKLKKKRSSLVGAFVSTHGCSIDEVDKSILEAKMSLLEVTQDLAERTQRWRQIEALCGSPIVNNPGLGHLKSAVRNVGLGRMTSSARMPTDLSPDDGSSNEDPSDDCRSTTTYAMRATTVTSSMATTLKSSVKGSTRQPILESSKESLLAATDEIRDLKTSSLSQGSMSHANLLALTYMRGNSGLNSSSNNLLRSSLNNSSKLLHQPKIGPGGRMMIKSFSHGAGSSMATTVAAMASRGNQNIPDDHRRLHVSGISTSVSDTHLQSAASLECDVGFSIGEDATENALLLSTHLSKNASVRSTNTSTKALQGSTDGLTEQLQEADTDDVDDASGELVDTEDSGSDFDVSKTKSNPNLNNHSDSKKSKKLKKFFNFSRKKEKVV